MRMSLASHVMIESMLSSAWGVKVFQSLSALHLVVVALENVVRKIKPSLT